MNKTLAALAATALLAVITTGLTGQTTTSAPASKPADEVKALFTAAAADAKAGKFDKLLALLPADEAAGIKPVLAGTQEMLPKVKKLAEAAKSKDVPLPSGLITFLSDGPAAMAPGVGPILHCDEISIDSKDDTVIISAGPSSMGVKKTDKGWQVQVPPETAVIVGVMPDMLKAMDAMVTDLTAGIEDGSITKDNLETKGRTLTVKHLQPISEKIQTALKGKTASAPAPDEK